MCDSNGSHLDAQNLKRTGSCGMTLMLDLKASVVSSPVSWPSMSTWPVKGDSLCLGWDRIDVT
jgi:hypothetical protein